MRLNQLDLNLLQILDGLLDERSATRVAARVGLTQPAISAALRRLRHHFGDELFVTVGRSMTPTPFAEELAAPVRQMLLQAEQVSRMRPDTDLTEIRRTLRVGASDYIVAVLLAKVLREASTTAPNLRFDLFSVLDTRSNYSQDLDRGDVDLLLIPQIYASPVHASRFVLEDPYVCLADRDRAPVADDFDLARYLALGHIALSRRTNVDHTYDELHLARAALNRRVEVSTPWFSMIPSLLVGTDRIATVQRSLARHFAARAPLAILPCPAPMPPMVQVMQWRLQQAKDPALSWLRDRIADAGGALAGEEQASPLDA